MMPLYRPGEGGLNFESANPKCCSYCHAICVQVLRYLQAFASAFQLQKYVRFNTEVTSAMPMASQKQVQNSNVQHQTSGSNESDNAAGNIPLQV